MSEQAQPAIVDPQGRPLSAARLKDRRCPTCKAGPERRVASAGFGEPHPVCGRCGHEFFGERVES